jgi:serine protease AprX
LRIKAFRDFTGGAGAVQAWPTDGYGHGTHVASIIGGTGELSTNLQYQGIAPNVNLIGLRVLDSSGAGLTSNVIAAIEWAVANKAQYGIRIINLSLGHPIYEPAAQDPLVQAVEAAVRAGIVVVASAGNYGMNMETGQTGYAGISSPGNAPSAITVGALDTKSTETRNDDTVASYSSRGPSWYDAYAKPDLVAPGHRLVGRSASSSSTLAVAAPQLLQYDKYGRLTYIRLSGSSMATAVVSGAVALMMARHDFNFPSAPELTPNAIKAILQYTALPLANVDNLTQGAGGLNAGAAVALAGGINTAASSGAYWASSGNYPQTTIAGVTYTWAQSYVWGPNVTKGNAILYNKSLWGLNIVWGDNLVWGDARNIVWGDARNIVWGDARNIVWGDNIVWGSACNITWGDSTVWGDARNIVWGDARNIVWGDARNIVWGDNIIWD